MAQYNRICIALTSLLLGLPGSATTQGVLGRVKDADTGARVASAAVALVDGGGRRVAATVTDSAGSFGLPVYSAGTYTLNVVHVAYAETRTRAIEIARDEVVQVDIQLSRMGFVLDPLLVTARREADVAYLTDYHERAERSETLGRGRILRREDLEPMEGLAVGDVLRRHPGTSRFADPLWNRACQPATYWNGLPMDVDGIPVSSVEGIEVYRRREVPAEYAGDAQARACGVILVWNRPVRPGEGRPWGMGRLALAAAAAVLFVFIAR